MAKEPTKADLLARIAQMEAAASTPRETPQDALVRALAAAVGGFHSLQGIKHLFYRSDDVGTQVSLDMHDGATP